MKLDWKVISSCEGYLSLKAAIAECYAYDNTSKQKYPKRTYSRYDKSRLRKLFIKVIDRAKHVRARTGLSVEEVLLRWENCRKDSRSPLTSFYASTVEKQFAKIPINPKHPLGSRGLRKMVQRDYSDKHDRIRVYKRHRFMLVAKKKSDKLKAQR